MSTTTAKPPVIQVSRVIKAPRERVFQAWTTPSDILNWFGCGGSKALSADVDLRVGGEYRIRINSEKCGVMDVVGVYREINPPSRLVFTWGWLESDPSVEREETTVTIDLIDRNGSTEVKITHEGLTDSDSRDRHAYGWNGCLDNFEKLV